MKIASKLIAGIAASLAATALVSNLEGWTPGSIEARSEAPVEAASPTFHDSDASHVPTESVVHVLGELRTGAGQAYTGPVTFRFVYAIDEYRYSSSSIEQVEGGVLDARIELPDVAVGRRLTIDAWSGESLYSRERSVFLSPSDGAGFRREVDIVDRNHVLSAGLGLCHFVEPDIIATIQVGGTAEGGAAEPEPVDGGPGDGAASDADTEDSVPEDSVPEDSSPEDGGPAEILVGAGALNRFRLASFAEGREVDVLAPTTIQLFSWNAADTWSLALRANGRLGEPIHVPRKGVSTLVFPKYASLDGTYGVATYPDLLHVAIVPTSEYVPFQPSKPEGYPRFKESVHRLRQNDWLDYPYREPPGTFGSDSLEPSTAYTIELWDKAAHRLGVPLATATVTTGASGSTVSLAVP